MHLPDIAPALRKDQWERLQCLRKGFLEGVNGDYWRDSEDVRLYDEVFAQRIEWKWEGVLRQIEATGWQPSASVLCDWGCGSGRISRLLASRFQFKKVYLHDHSKLALQFALAAHKQAQLPAVCTLPRSGMDDGYLLIVSHVLGELGEASLVELLDIARCAVEILWVEPGDRITSTKLSRVHQKLQAYGFNMIAPCTHQQSCPILNPDAAPHWCHFFARPPSWIFQSAFWRDVSERLEIDLRSLPFSFLAATKINNKAEKPAHMIAGRNRVIGVPSMHKAFAEVLTCADGELHTIRISKREDKESYRSLKKQRESCVLP